MYTLHYWYCLESPTMSTRKTDQKWSHTFSIGIRCDNLSPNFTKANTTLLKGEENAQDNHVLACNFDKYSPISKFSPDRLSNKPVLIRSLTAPPHLKYIATLPYNLSWNCLLSDINVSQGSVATYARCGVIFSNHFSANSSEESLCEKIANRLRFDRIMAMRLWPHFLAHPVYKLSANWHCLLSPTTSTHKIDQN